MLEEAENIVRIFTGYRATPRILRSADSCRLGETLCYFKAVGNDVTQKAPKVGNKGLILQATCKRSYGTISE